MEFSRQGYWSRSPLPPPGDLLNPVIKPASLASPALAGWCFTTEPPGKPPPTSMATNKRKKKCKSWQEGGEIGTPSHCWWECKME